MIYTLDGELHLSDVPTPLLHQLIRELTVPNPRYENALRLGRPAWNIPRTIMLYEIKGNALTLPRGMAEEVWRQRPAGTVSKDRTLRGEPCAFEKAGFTLRDYQKQAVDAALACKYKGERIAMQEMRKQIGWYVKGLPHAAALRRDACTMNTLGDLRTLLAREGFLIA